MRPLNIPHGWRLHALSLALIGLALLLRFPVKFAFEPPFLMDLNAYRFAAELVRTGQGHALYSLGYNEEMYFKYAPIWALVWSPLAYLGPHAGAIVWSVLNAAWMVLMLGLGIGMLHQLGRRAPVWAAAATTLLLARPLLAEFGNGQADPWWASLVAWGIVSEVADRPRWAGFALACSIALKLPSAIALPYLLFVKRWKTARWTLGWFMAIIIAGALMVSPQAPWQLISAWSHRLGVMGPQYVFRISDQSLLALFGRLLTDDGYGLNLFDLSRPAVTVVAAAAGAGLFTLVALPWPRADHSDAFRRAVDLSLLLILMVLGSPSAWPATYCALTIPVFLALSLSAQLPRAARRDPRLLVWTGLMLLCNLFTHSSAWKAIGLRVWHHESYVFLVFMTLPLFGLMVFAILHRQRQLMWSTKTAERVVAPVVGISGN